MEPTPRPSTESLQSVVSTQADVEDIEDLLAVMDGVVQGLKDNPSEVDLQCLMYKYAHLETSLLESLEYSTRQSSTDTRKQKLVNAYIERYTALGPDFQAEWDEKLWTAYKVATSGYKVDTDSRQETSLRGLSEKLRLLQGLAETLHNLSAHPDSHRTTSTGLTVLHQETLQPLFDAAVESHSRQKSLTAKNAESEHCCARCRIY